MNCRPNELAVVVRLHPDDRGEETSWMQRILGHIVRVIEIRPNGKWSIETRISCVGWPIGNGLYFAAGEIDAIDDCMLQPLRGDLTGDPIHIQTDVPEAVRLAWGIEAPVLI